MVNNFVCQNCDHYMVCEKMKHIMKFHESAKKDLMITITMDECMDYAPDEDAKDTESANSD